MGTMDYLIQSIILQFWW